MGASSDKNKRRLDYNKLEEILCSKCGDIPEIIDAHTDNGKIELKCKNCGVYEVLFDDYYEELSKNYYFKECNKCKKKNNNNYYYCFNCKKVRCESCKNNNHSNHYCIQVNIKNGHCLKHNKEFKYFCFDCDENLCEDETENEHKGHKVEEISKFGKSFLDYLYKIKKINCELSNIVEFNDCILKNSEIFKNKYYFLKSIINLGKSLEEGNKRNSKDIKYLLSGLSKDIENSLEAIHALIDKKTIQLNRKDKYIHINNMELNDQDFKYISQIRFNQLKEIDISENKIKDIEPFKKMSLPFLEFLNLSHNEIQIIEPITKLNSKNLQYIFLQNNKIEDIETFLESDFPCLKILRVEDNNLNEENGEDEEKKKNRENILKNIDSKYPEKFIFRPIKEIRENFKERFKLEISEDNEEIDLSDMLCGDGMLKHLFLIITSQNKNKIKKLILRNNKIKDPSILNRINFNKLEILDLAVNEITNINFISDMKAENLKYLYLDNNQIKDIYPILNTNFPNLSILCLNNNNFNVDDIEYSEYIKLKNKKDRNGKNLDIQLRDLITIKESLFSQNHQTSNNNELFSLIQKNPESEFLCPICHKLEPEILNLNVDNKTVEFQCKICGENDYKFEYYKKIESDNIICYYFNSKEDNQKNKLWLKEYKNQPQNLKSNKNSSMEQISTRDLKEYKEIIKQKNEQLKKIIKFNEVIISTFENHQNNYLYFNNLKNICKSFEREKFRDSNDLKFLFASFKNELEISSKAIEKLLDKKKVKIEREEEYLNLSNKKINDENIKYLSLIKFNQLKDIDLSENEIINIEPLCKMQLPFLEKLNLSFNKINNIKPLSEINSKKLKYLFIQNNQIEDIQVFIDFSNNFNSIDILRLDNNNINENSDTFKKLLKVWNKNNQILVTNKKIDEIQKHYKIEYNEYTKIIEIEGIEEGDSMLKNISIIISCKSKNRIKKLKLKANKIVDPTIINRIQFNCLEELDLSMNNIKSLNFLKGLKAKELTCLFLDNNNINDLSILYNIKELFPNLKSISLNNNNFNPEESKYKALTKYLNCQNIILN